MPRENLLMAVAARLAGLPFRLRTLQPFVPPKKAIILKPCCMSQVMLATPLLAVLSETFPEAQIDWAVGEWARPVIATNPRVAELIDTGRVGLPGGRWSEVGELIGTLREQAYDTCIIPSRSSLLSYVAWRAGIPQRVGLRSGGRGFAHTLPVKIPEDAHHEAEVYLALARAVGIETPASIEFFPTDAERTAATERLVDEIDWLGDVPLIILHPGGADNPARPDERKRWPVERFALLGSQLARLHGAKVLLVGSEQDRPLAEAVDGMMSSTATNLAGRLSLGELGALCEVADLYVGVDAGPTHIAAAVGCSTLAIFGPSDPAVSGPYGTKGQVIVLRPAEISQPFSWAQGATVEEALAAAEELLGRKNEAESTVDE